MRSLGLRFVAFVLLLTGSAASQEVLEDQDPVDPDWVPAWDAPFWPAPSGAAFEVAAGRTGTLAPSGTMNVGQIGSGDYLLAWLTLPLGARPLGARSRVQAPADDADADESTEEGQPEDQESPAAVGPPEAGRTVRTEPDPPEGESDVAASPRDGRGRMKASGGEIPLELVQEAIERAEVAAGFQSSLRRLSSVGQRARWSGLAPELRLRGASGFDQTRSVDSGSIVPSDQTLRDGSDALVEVRLTFHLERLLHAGQEVALERARQQLFAERAEVRALISEELVTYVRSLRRAEDEALDDDEREKLEFAAERARLSLFLLTDGWFRGEETLHRYEVLDARRTGERGLAPEAP